MGAEARRRTEGVRDRILSRLKSTGEITDSSGLASATLSKAVEYRGSSAAFAQLLSGMERDGLIEREIRGKRTYRIGLAGDRGKPHLGEVWSASTASAGNGVAADFDYEELAGRLLAQVVRRITAAPEEGFVVPGSDPVPRADDLALTLISLERRLASIQSRQRELSEETVLLRAQLAAAKRSLAEIQAGFAGEPLELGERQVLQRLLSSLHTARARRRSAEAG